MKVLVVCSGNAGYVSTFIVEQVDALKSKGVIIEYFLINGKGFWGYLRNYKEFYKKLKEFDPKIVHAHYGLSAMLAVLQRRVPVVTTLHGSDVNYSFSIRLISQIAVFLSKHVIFSHHNLTSKMFYFSNRYSIIETGFDLSKFEPVDKTIARSKFSYIPNDKNVVLFSSNFNRKEKNPELAINACNLIENTILVEFKDVKREDVKYLINACDVVLVTSFYETGPLVIKEALACNTPVISTDVGIARELLTGIEGCYIVKYDKYDIADKLRLVFQRKQKVNSRHKVLKYDNNLVAAKIINIYNNLTKTTET